jgi:hypothetical protein
MAILFKLLFFSCRCRSFLVAPAPRKKYNSFKVFLLQSGLKNTNPWKNSHRNLVSSHRYRFCICFYQGDSLFIVSDNSGFLYEYTIGTGTVNEYPLLKNAIQNIAKQDKPDFEAITHFQDTFICIWFWFY